MHSSTPAHTGSNQDIALRLLKQLECCLLPANTKQSGTLVHVCIVQQLEVEVTQMKTDLRSISHDLATLEFSDNDDVVRLEMHDGIYECFLCMKRQLLV